MKKLLPAVLVLFTMVNVSCRKEAQNIPVQVRVQNLSSFSLESVTMLAKTDEEPFERQYLYGNLGSSQVSSYQSQDIVYNMPSCKFKLNGKWMQFVPRCGEGLQRLAPGRFTLKILADESGNIHSLEFIKD